MSQSFIEELARPQSSPGGGAAASCGAALGLALLQKVIHLEERRAPSHSETARRWNERLARVRDLAVEIRRLGDEDSRSYMRISDARSCNASESEIDEALGDSVRLLAEIIRTVQKGLALVLETEPECKPYLVPDLQAAAELLAAGAEGAYRIAEANLRLIKSMGSATDHRQEVIRAMNRVRSCLAAVRSDPE